jgi:hypothetical protein
MGTRIVEAAKIRENCDADDVNEELMKSIGKMSDAQFWKWVSSWYDVESIMDTIRNWDEDTQRESLVQVRKIMGR